MSSTTILPNAVVNFSNLNAPPERQIYRGDWVYANGAYEFSNVQPCAGSGFHIALFGGPEGATEDNLWQVGGPAAFLTGARAGTFAGGNRTIATSEPGPVLSFQVRVWEGPAFTYQQAVAEGAATGRGPVLQIDTKDPDDLIEVSPVLGQADDWRGFVFGRGGVTTFVVPEPSTVSLTIVAIASLLLLRRRKPSL